jgi:predicted transcriptional regulator
MTVHVTIALDEAVKAKLDALADVRQATIDDIVAMAVLDMAVEDEAVPFMSAEEKAAFHAAVDEGLRSLDAGGGIPHEVVVAELRARQAARTQR